jgi:hypothetical protein
MAGSRGANSLLPEAKPDQSSQEGKDREVDPRMFARVHVYRLLILYAA